MKITKTHLFARIILLILSAALIITCATTANYSGLGKGTDKVPLASGVLTGRLANGLRYYILENSFPENRAYLGLIVNAGSVVEKDNERGFAHFVEHLAFNGTARFPEYELIEYLRSLGMRFGADLNAYTSYDETVYYFDVPVENINGTKRIPEKALAILDDWTYAVSFNPGDVADESLVVLEELRARLGAMDRARKIILPVLFSGSAYEDREVIGIAQQIENATSQQLKAFYDRWYRSDNMAVVFAGDFDAKALEAQLEGLFNMPASSSPVNRPLYELPPPVSGNFHVEIIIDPELTSASYDIFYKQKQTAQRGTIEYYRQYVIDTLISIMLSLRFEEAMTDPQSASNGSWGNIWNWSSSSRFYNMGTVPKTGNSNEALRELLLEKESIRRYGFTESELSRAKLTLVSAVERMVSEKDRMDSSMYINAFISHFLYGEAMPDIEWEAAAIKTLLPGIGTKEISQAVSSYFSANDITVFLLAPQAEERSLPSKEMIRSIFSETERAQISRRQEISLTGNLLERTPQPASVSTQRIDQDTGAHILTFSNGATVILQETSNRNNEITLYAAAKGGITNASLDDYVSVSLLSDMISVSGIGPFSRTELINRLAGKQVSLSFWNNSFTRGFEGSSTTQDLVTLFELINLFFTNPKLDERAIAAVLDQYRTYLAYQDDDPQVYFYHQLDNLIYNNHPQFKPLEYSDIDRVSVARARAFLDRCVNPGDYTFVFTGNIDVNTMRELAAIYIGSIPNAASMNNWVNPSVALPQEVKKIIYKGVDERSIVYLGWYAAAPSAFNEQLNQTSAVLTEYLNIILNDEIREKLGGVYSIYAGVSTTVIPAGKHNLDVYFVCSPHRVDELVSAVQNCISSVLRSPVNADIFNKAKEALLMGHDRSIQDNSHIAQSYVNSSHLYNTPLSRLYSRPGAIRAVTAQDIQSLCRTLLSSGPVQLLLYPEGWR